MDPATNAEFAQFHFDSILPPSGQRDDYEKHLLPFRKDQNSAHEGLAVDQLREEQGPIPQSLPNPSTLPPASLDGESLSSSKEKTLGEQTPTVDTSVASSGGSASESQEGDDIVWHYLTYETPLPNPSHASGNADNAGPPPEAPDLTRFRNPLKWSHGRKSALIWLSCAATAITAYSAGCYAPGIDQMSAEWNVGEVAATVGIPSFTAGFAIAPMILAPFSELNGRRPIFLITGFLFLIFTLCCALTQIYAGMIVSRFLAGCASSTFSTMVGGVVSDIYVASERNTPMTLFTGSALFGTGLGPLVSGFVAQHLSWRWIFYIHAMLVGVLVVALVIFFNETRGSVLLSKKAKKLNEWYEAREKAGHYGFDMTSTKDSEKTQSQRIRWKVKSDEERSTIRQMIAVSVVRPFHLLFTEPVVFFFSLWISFAWAILYCTFSVIPYMYETVYGFSLEQSGGVFAAISVASVLATALCIAQERLATRRGLISDAPESRLVFTCVESAFLPAALFWFGWTSSPDIHWIVPTLAIGAATVGIFSVYLAVFNYLADTYHRYSSSAIAAQSFCRNLLGGCFPLFTRQMFEALGFGGAGSLLGGIGVVLTLVPWVLMLFGPKIRARSKFASEILAGD